MKNYAYNKKPVGRTARATIRGVNASYKDLCEVCTNVRGKDTDYAIDFLADAAEMKKAILFLRHNTGKGHRRELGGKKGGWPIKCIKIILGLLQSAQANANKLGLGRTKIAHIMANKVNTYPRMSPKGRRIVHNYETAFAEVVLEEIQEKADMKKDVKKDAKRVEKKVEQKKISAAAEKSPGSANLTKTEAKTNLPTAPAKAAAPLANANKS